MVVLNDETQLLDLVRHIIENTLHEDENAMQIIEADDSIKHMIHQDLESGEITGWMQWNDYTVSFSSKYDGNESTILLCDSKQKDMRVFRGKRNTKKVFQLIEEGVKRGKRNPTITLINGILDIGTNGRRWEGTIANGVEPRGYGVMYDENDHPECEGFLFEGKKVCYGKEYHARSDILKYEGGFSDGKYFGTDGKMYDRHGDIEFSGSWCYDSSLKERDFIPGQNLHSCQSELLIECWSYREEDTNLILTGCLLKLEYISILSNSLSKVQKVIVDGLPNLLSFLVEKYSGPIEYKENSWLKQSEFSIRNCPKLKDIDISKQCFCYVKVFQLKHLPLLQEIVIREQSFDCCHEVCFEGIVFCSFSHFCLDLPSITTLVLNSRVFQYCHEFTVNSIPLKNSSYLRSSSSFAHSIR